MRKTYLQSRRFRKLIMASLTLRTSGFMRVIKMCLGEKRASNQMQGQGIPTGGEVVFEMGSYSDTKSVNSGRRSNDAQSKTPNPASISLLSRCARTEVLRASSRRCRDHLFRLWLRSSSDLLDLCLAFLCPCPSPSRVLKTTPELPPGLSRFPTSRSSSPSGWR